MRSASILVPRIDNYLEPGAYVHLAGADSFQVGQTAKARSGYRVQSLRRGRDRQCSHNLARVALALQSGESCRNWHDGGLFKVVQCGPTSILATNIMGRSEEMKRPVTNGSSASSITSEV